MKLSAARTVRKGKEPDPGAGTPIRALVTGAAAGLGREIAVRLHERGVRLLLVDRNRHGLDDTAALLQAEPGSCALFVADLTAPEQREEIVRAASASHGGLDCLINCAGIGHVQPFFEMEEAVWSRTLSTNVTALVMLTNAVARLMKDSGIRGRIINVTSPASRMALPNYAAYAASKAAVDSFTRTASVALARFGITVNSVAPGMMDTEMQQTTEAELARIEGREDVEAFLYERTLRVPLGRRAQVGEVADSVVWLALDAPGYITCERLNVSGGLDRD